MNSILTLFSQTWNILARDKRSFLVIFLFQSIPGFLILTVVLGFFAFLQWGVPLLGERVYSLVGFFTTPTGIIILVICLLLALLVFVAFQTLCYYCAQKWLAQLFHKKKISVRLLLCEWRGVWSWMGTWLSIISYFIGFVLMCFILAMLASYVHDFLVIGVFILSFFGFIFLWVSLYLAIPGYFLDGKRYYLSAKNAFSLMRNRWWKTFGYIFVVLIFAAIVSLLFIVVEKIVGTGLYYIPESFTSSPAFAFVATTLYVFYAFVQLGINIWVQIFLSAYSFQLYSLYKKNTPNTLK